MAEMSSAFAADHFLPNHTMTPVDNGGNNSLVNGLIETWPSGSGVEFRVRIEQPLMASSTIVDAMFVIVPVFPRERPLGSLFPQNAILFTRKLFLPLFVRLDLLIVHNS